MKRILLSIAILLFLAAGIGVWLLYSLGEKALERSIIELSELEPGAYESSKAEKPAKAGLDTVEPTGGDEKAAGKDIKGNNTAKATKNNDSSSAATALKNNAGGNISAQESEYYSLEEAEMAKDIKNKVPISEKASLTKLLLSKLTKKDISELQGMLSNGITAEEKERAKAILYSRLSTEDINRIKEAYIKYTQQ